MATTRRHFGADQKAAILKRYLVENAVTVFQQASARAKAEAGFQIVDFGLRLASLAANPKS
jgi:hypothetical protein